MKPVQFYYLNHKGITRLRTVVPEALEVLLEPGFGYAPGWFLSGQDLDKGARRSFALGNIQVPADGEGISAVVSLRLIFSRKDS